MKFWCIVSGVMAVAAVLTMSLNTRNVAVRTMGGETAERVPDYAPVEVSQPRVTLDLGFEPFDSVAHSVPEVKNPTPLPKPLREIADRPVGGAGVQFIKPFVEKPEQIQAGKRVRVSPLTINWPDRTPTRLTGHVVVVANYDSRGRLDSCRIISERPQGLGFGSVVKDALRNNSICTTEAVRVTWDLEIAYGREPIVKFASSGLEVVQ